MKNYKFQFDDSCTCFFVDNNELKSFMEDILFDYTKDIAYEDFYCTNIFRKENLVNPIFERFVREEIAKDYKELTEHDANYLSPAHNWYKVFVSEGEEKREEFLYKFDFETAPCDDKVKDFNIEVKENELDNFLSTIFTELVYKSAYQSYKCYLGRNSITFEDYLIKRTEIIRGFLKKHRVTNKEDYGFFMDWFCFKKETLREN